MRLMIKIVYVAYMPAYRVSFVPVVYPSVASIDSGSVS